MREDFNLLKDDVYSVRTEGNRLRITKFTKDLHPVQFYCVEETADGGYRCNCPQSNRGPCKHFDIMDSYALYPERIDKGWFYCHQTGDWFPPIEGSSPIEPPAAGGGEAGLDPSTASPVTPEVETRPPESPSGVMVFSEPLKRRI